MEKFITIDGKEVRLVANGATPRLYRSMFKKDVFADMTNAISSNGEIKSAEVFENLCFVMAKQGGLEGDIDSWLASMDSPTAVITVAPDILDLWADTNETVATGKKK